MLKEIRPAIVLLVALALITGLATQPSGDSMVGLGVLLGFAAPLPIVTAVLAWRPVVAGWVGSVAQEAAQETPAARW